jgi:hypothetical protein
MWCGAKIYLRAALGPIEAENDAIGCKQQRKQASKRLWKKDAHITISFCFPQLYSPRLLSLWICPGVKIDPAWNVGIIPLSPAALARRRRLRGSRVREYISYSRPREQRQLASQPLGLCSL